MSKLGSQRLVALQHEIWMSYGGNSAPYEMVVQLSQHLITILHFHSVSLLQQANDRLNLASAEYTQPPASPNLEHFPHIQRYRQLHSPNHSSFIETVGNRQSGYWYCFALKGVGYLILEHHRTLLEDTLLTALAQTFGRFRHEYTGRLLEQDSDDNHNKIKMLSAHLQSEKDKLEQILGSISDGVIVLDWQGNVYFANKAAHSMLGLQEYENFTGHFTNFFRIYEINEEKINLTKPVVEHCMTHGRWEREEPVILRCERLADTYARIVVRQLGNVTKAPDLHSYFVCTFHDVTEIYQAKQKLKWQAVHDPLTGCLNRRGFEDALRSSIGDKKRQTHHVLICMDLDRFKHVNDIGGHLAGDALLKHITTLIQQEIRGSDQLARVGGDEFCIILERCDEQKAFEIAERVRKRIDRLRFQWENNIFTVGVSIGLSVIELEDDNADLVYCRTDMACSNAKDNGRNQVSCAHRRPAEPGSDSDYITESPLNYLHCLNQALSELDDSCQLVLFRQTINAITPNYADHQEVLLRIQRNGKLISPNSFLPAAERCGKVTDIDLWVLSNTLDYLTQHKDYKLNVNLSGITLSNDKARRQIYEILLAYPVEANYLCLEITETAAITNLGKCIQFMEKLHCLGVTFALDDFGTGVSSFGYLKSLPVKYLKIDGSFIRDICDNEIDEILVQSIIAAAKAMKIRTVAEYVSDTNTLNKVRAMGIDYAQGFCLGKPEQLHILQQPKSHHQGNLGSCTI